MLAVPPNVSTAPVVKTPQIGRQLDLMGMTQTCFRLVLQLRLPQSPADFAYTYATLREALDDLLQHPAALGTNQRDAGDVAYAIVALADEIALKASPELAQFWLPRRLQMLYFNDNMAGEGFFRRLDAVSREPQRHQTLQAYYVALAMGFEGRYGRQESPHEIMALMASVHQKLMAQTPLQHGALAPEGVPHDILQKRVPWYQSTPAWLAACASFAGLAYGLMAVHLGRTSQYIACCAETLFYQLGG